MADGSEVSAVDADKKASASPIFERKATPSSPMKGDDEDGEKTSAAPGAKVSCPEVPSRSPAVSSTVDQHKSDESSPVKLDNPFSKLAQAILLEHSTADTESQATDENEENKVADPPQPRDIKLKRKFNQPMMTLPRPIFNNFDCKEKIVLCIDHSESMFSTSVSLDGKDENGSKSQVFSAVVNALKHFLYSKFFINGHHEYSLVLVNEDAQLITDFSSQSGEVVQMLHDIWNSKSLSHQEDLSSSSTSLDAVFDASLLFQQLSSMVKVPPKGERPPYVVRVIFVYGRPRCRVQLLGDTKLHKEMMSNPNFFFDALYIHESPSEDNNVEEIYDDLCGLDLEERCYLLESDVKRGAVGIFESFTKLLFHPFQRQPPYFDFDLELRLDSIDGEEAATTTNPQPTAAVECPA